MQHFEGPPSKNKDTPLEHMKPTAERLARVHDPIVKAALNVSLPKPGEKKIAIMTMGGPASGKGTVLKQVSAAGHPMVLVDPDHVKGQLPEYRQTVPPAGSNKPTFKGAAAMVHEESSFLAKRIRSEAVDAGHHIVIDGTGTNAKKFIATMKELKEKGYEVQVHFPHLEHDTGLERAKARASGSGRYVPDSFISHSYSLIDNNVEKIMAAAKEHGASFHMYDASKKGHPLSFSQVGGTETVHSPEHHEAFTNRTKRPLPGK
jgi:predicted ABC-type ATPase